MTWSEKRGERSSFLDILSEATPYLLRYLAAWVPLVAAYIAVFVYSNDQPFGWALLAGLTNITVPLVLGIPLFALLGRWVFKASPLVQMAAHLVLSTIFTFTWLAILIRELGVISWLRYGTYQAVQFAGPALTWQLFQGLTVYFLIVAGAYVIIMMVRGSYLLTGLAPTENALETMPDASKAARRIFVKDAKGYVPLDFEDIVSISGAGDYCEVKSANASHLLRIKLAEFEELLEPDRFVRVHRSHIVSLSRIEKIEPRSGGRLILHILDGDTVFASRSGASRLQRFLVA